VVDNRLARKVWLTPPDFSVIVQTSAEEIATLTRGDEEREGQATDQSETTGSAATPTANGKASSAPIDVPASAASVPAAPTAEPERPARPPETPEESAERERRYREMFGIVEPKRRRRWRR